MKDKYKDYIAKYEEPRYWIKPEKDDKRNYERNCLQCNRDIVVKSPFIRLCGNCRDNC